jgi:hypothetical protein
MRREMTHISVAVVSLILGYLLGVHCENTRMCKLAEQHEEEHARELERARKRSNVGKA